MTLPSKRNNGKMRSMQNTVDNILMFENSSLVSGGGGGGVAGCQLSTWILVRDR